MIAEPSAAEDSNSVSDRTSAALLAAFLATNPGARTAGKSLRAGAEVAVTLGDTAGDWRVLATAAGQLTFEQAKAADPDFELHIPPRAVQSLCASSSADMGALAVDFFELVVARDQQLKIHVKVNSGLIKLTRRGWLAVIAQGGPKVMMWLARKGLHGPGAITAALRKFSG